jgi:hypothetical protein
VVKGADDVTRTNARPTTRGGGEVRANASATAKCSHRLLASARTGRSSYYVERVDFGDDLHVSPIPTVAVIGPARARLTEPTDVALPSPRR